MTSRRPLQPLSPLSANIVGAKYSYITKVSTNVDAPSAMDGRVQDEHTQNSQGSLASGLTALESDADDFDRLMIQQARDERRLNDALRGNVQPFRKARAHPNVGLTLENLERNNASSGPRTSRSPPSIGSSSDSGSMRSNTAIRVPAEWGRKGRVRRDWLRTITNEEEQKPGAQEDSVVEDATPRQAEQRAESTDADRPLPSVEDSPLSRKSSRGTPSSARRGNANLDRIQDWDFTMDLNEASLIASTPYIPRNTALDDIRQREIDSLKEQAVTTSRLDKIRETSPEESRRPRSSSRHSVNERSNSAAATERVAQPAPVSPGNLRKRTNSWKTIGKSQAVTAENAEQIPTSPIVVYKKSAETVGIVDRSFSANAQKNAQRPSHRRDDSHDLLRRLARVSSSTPSPGRTASMRPQTAPAAQPEPSSSPPKTDPLPTPPPDEQPLPEITIEDTVATAPEVQPQQSQPLVERKEDISGVSMEAIPAVVDVDATPLPVEASILNAKTPKITGGWIDTPAAKMTGYPAGTSRPRSTSPRKALPNKRSPEKQKAQEPQAVSRPSVEPARPALPRSALEAIVEEAKGNAKAKGKSRFREDTLGDSTIDSLEDLLAPGDDLSEIEQDEDTLLGLQLPTTAPRTESERVRQQELVHLHRMNQRLRATRTGVRDANRGLRRLEKEVEGNGATEGGARVVYRDCPCAAHGGHQCTPWSNAWTGFKRTFYDPTLTRRWGLTWLTIFLITFVVYFVSEVVACDKFCHKFYASRMVGFGVVWDAPRFPFVLPTLFYRKFVRPFWRPLWSFLVWAFNATYSTPFEDETVRQAASRTVKGFARTVAQSYQQTWEPEYRMSDDEFI